MEPDKDRSESSAPGAEVLQPFDPAHPLLGALQDLYRALHSTSIYPLGHPAIRQAVERAWSQLSAALEGRPNAMIGIARDHLLIDRAPVEDAGTTLATLAQFLHSLDVAVVELRSNLTVLELERFLIRLREARHASRGGAALALTLAEDKLEGIRIVPLDYFGLSFVPHADRERGAGNSSDVWDGLVVNLAGLTSPKLDVAPEALAQEANRHFVTEDGVGSGLLRQQMQELRQRMPDMDDWQREALRARLSRFVGALNSNLRQDLLRVDPADGGLSLQMMAELSDTLPDTALLDILRDLNRSGQRAHDQFLNFMNKMARIPSEKSDTVVDLDAVLARWRIAGAVEENPGTFRSALKEVLLRRKQIECNPDSYQEHLDELTHRELSPATRVALARYRDPCDPVDVKCHAVELALLLLEDGAGREHAPGMLAHIGAATDMLLDSGRFQPVRDAAVAARTICAREGEGDETRHAAASYLRDFTMEARIDRILACAERAGSASAAVEPLLALGGTAALQRVIDRLDADPDGPLAPMLRSVAVTLGRSPMAQVIEARKIDGWARLRPALSVARLLAPSDAVEVLESLVGHPESRVRREVMLALCEVDCTAGSPERHLRRGLNDPELWIAQTAIDRLAAIEGDAGLALLGSYLAGKVGRIVSMPVLARRVSRCLLARGNDGRGRLCASLDLLSRSWRIRRIRVGAIVRAELEPSKDDPAVARSLTGWRRSPAGWIAAAVSIPAALAEDRN